MYKIIKLYILILKGKRGIKCVYVYESCNECCSLWLYRIMIWLKCMYNI